MPTGIKRIGSNGGMMLPKCASGKPFKILVFSVCLGISVATFYIDISLIPDDIALLLPYVLAIYLGTFLIGNRSGLFFSAIAIIFWLVSNSGMLRNMSGVFLVDLAIKSVFIMSLYFIVRYSRKLYADVKDLSLQDELTGLNNRRGFLTLAQYEIRRMERTGDRFSLLYLDIDNFKEINDTRGHREGDKVLSELGSIVMKTTRSVDIAARMGGDEFCILLPGADDGDMRDISARIVRDFAELCSQSSWHATLSVGSVTTTAEYDLEAVIREGDRLMYAAKRGGKNSIEYGRI